MGIQRIGARLRKLVSYEYFPILTLILINLIISTIIVTDFGESWDEQWSYRYAGTSISAYFGGGRVQISEKGPSYLMISRLGAQGLRRILPGWVGLQAWHWMHFLSFQVGLFFLYRLSRRFAGKYAAMAAVFLCTTQPLLWGHAFINPKDIPFMAFFVASVEMGLTMADAFLARPSAYGNALVASKWVGLTLLSGAFLGFVSAIRVLGPVSGVLVAFYFLIKARWRALPALALYAATGIVVTYLAWPGIWGSPLQNYLTVLQLATDFPWEGKVLFGGVEYGVDELPRSYLPTLLSFQFTEPTLLLALAGMLVAVAWSIRGKMDWALGVLIGAWFFMPILFAIIFRPHMYGNFRHFFFALPPLFVFAAIAWQGLLDRLRLPIWIALVALAVLPGLFSMVRLHPYSYVYYNSLAGGTGGAFRLYEMDYWGTSYQEATEYLNAVAPASSKVVVWGPVQIVKNYARPDLIVIDYQRLDRHDPASLSFAILSTRHEKDLYLFPQAQLAFQVGRNGALFAVVKDLRQGEAANP